MDPYNRNWGTVLILVPIFSSLLFSCTQPIPEEALARYLHAKRDYEAGRLEQAHDKFTELAAERRRFFQAAFMEGKTAFLLGKISEAEVVFRGLTSRQPAYFEAAFWQARSLAQLGYSDKAEQKFARLLSFNSQDPRILYQLALLALEREDVPAALEYLRRAEAFSEEFAKVILQLGRLYYQFGLNEKATLELSRARSMLPADHPLVRGIESLQERILKETGEKH